MKKYFLLSLLLTFSFTLSLIGMETESTTLMSAHDEIQRLQRLKDAMLAEIIKLERELAEVLPSYQAWSILQEDRDLPQNVKDLIANKCKLQNRLTQIEQDLILSKFFQIMMSCTIL